MDEQHKLATSWSKTLRDAEYETQRLRNRLYTILDPSTSLVMVRNLAVLWKSFKSIHLQYVFGVKKRKRLEGVKFRVALFKEEMPNVVTECQKNDQAIERPLLKVISQKRKKEKKKKKRKKSFTDSPQGT